MNLEIINSNLTDNLEFYVTVGLLIANLSVAILIAIQLKQAKNQFMDLNRPWLHLHIKTIKEIKYAGGTWGDNRTFHTYYSLILENSGNLTAKNVQIMTNGAIEDTEIINSSHFEEFYPNHSQILSENIEGLSSSESDVITFTILYEFPKKKVSKTFYLYEPIDNCPILTDKKPLEPKKEIVN